jgi:hypothetical protein
MLHVAALALAPALALAATANYTIGFQIHSYNDLRAWDQLLPKMASSFSPFPDASAPVARSTLMMKIDPQYLPAAACKRQTRVPSGSTGCLVLNHDTVGGSSRTNMNTTDDVLTLIADPSRAAFFRNTSRPVAISLCFKGCGGGACPCDDSAASRDWLALLDGFFAAANATISANKLSVEFLLDGDGNPGQHACLAQRWRPTASMFISTNDPAASFMSNDPSQGFDRLQVLNEPAGAVWSLAASLGFGKFAAAARPYVVWEPSDAAGMLAAAATYLGAGAAHAAGFRHAINTDVATWASFTASATGAWWRAPAPGPVGTAAAPRREPLLATAPLASGGTLALSLTRASASSAWAFATFTFASTAGGAVPAALASGALPADGVAAAATALALVPLNNGSALGLLSGPAGTRALLVAADGALAVGASFPPAPASLAVGFAACAGAGGAAAAADICVVTVSDARSAGCDILVSFGRLGAAPTASACAAVAVPGALASVAIAAAAFVRGGSVDVQVTVALVYSNGNAIFGATLCAPASAPANGDVRVNDPDCFGELRASESLLPRTAWAYPPGTNASLTLYVGSAAGVALAARPSGGPEGGDTIGVLALAAGSHCANNEADNKRDDVALCDIVPPAGGSAYVSYHAGSLQGFAAVLLGAEARWRGDATGGAGACSGLLATGMVAEGGAAAPAPALARGPRGFEALALVEGAAGVAGRPAADKRKCGADMAAPDDVLALSFPVPQDFF